MDFADIGIYLMVLVDICSLSFPVSDAGAQVNAGSAGGVAGDRSLVPGREGCAAPLAGSFRCFLLA